MQKRDETVPVRVVLNARHLPRNTIFIALKINYPVNTPCSAAPEASRRLAVMIPATVLLNPLAKRLLGRPCRQFRIIINHRTVPATRACRFINSNRHNISFPYVG
jgi:hypothetical protein